MLQNPETTRFRLITTLARIRREWQDASTGVSLIEVEGNIGLLLADLINGLGLNTAEQLQILGGDLHQEMQEFLKSPAQN